MQTKDYYQENDMRFQHEDFDSEAEFNFISTN